MCNDFKYDLCIYFDNIIEYIKCQIYLFDNGYDWWSSYISKSKEVRAGINGYKMLLFLDGYKMTFCYEDTNGIKLIPSENGMIVMINDIDKNKIIEYKYYKRYVRSQKLKRIIDGNGT